MIHAISMIKILLILLRKLNIIQTLYTYLFLIVSASSNTDQEHPFFLSFKGGYSFTLKVDLAFIQQYTLSVEFTKMHFMKYFQFQIIS